MKAIFHDVQQNTEEWESLRIGKITSSSIGLIMANYGKAFGDPAKRHALKIALERMSGLKAEYSFSNDHTERGHEQEPIARSEYEAMMFVDVQNGGFFELGNIGASPDFLSRLCGGELATEILYGGAAFLSRLCGGELSFPTNAFLSRFLSRLCGGEHDQRVIY